MEKTDPKPILILLIVIAGFFAMKAMIPHKKYSTQAYWESDRPADAAYIPAAALAPAKQGRNIK